MPWKLTAARSSGFTGAQETAVEIVDPPGVYEQIPLKGIIIWNSHAFNLTNTAAKQEAWINLYFAPPEDQIYPKQGIFDASQIFVADVPPFETREYCDNHVLDVGTRLFELSSHNHKHGKRFTIFDPNGNLVFTNLIYNDPIVKRSIHPWRSMIPIPLPGR